MKWFVITKTQGFILGLLLASPYLWLYLSFFGKNRYSMELTLFFVVGVLFHFIDKIEAGTRAELLFVGKATGYFWEDGFCLTPSTLPILHNIGIRPLWSLKRQLTYEGAYRTDRDISIKHFQDQKRPNYNMTIQTTWFGMAASRILEGIFGWFMSYNDGDPLLLFQRVGTRIVYIAMILGVCANIVYPVQSNTQPLAARFANILNFENPFRFENPFFGEPLINSDTTVTNKIQLEQGMPAKIPSVKDFASQPEMGAKIFVTMEDDSRKYVLFHEGKLGEDAQLTVSESLCAIVPYGRELYIFTKTRPMYALNMEGKLQFVAKEGKKGFYYTWKDQIFDIQGKMIKGRWKDVYHSWNDVDSEFAILVRALPREKIFFPDSVPGGIVCF